MIKLPNKDHQKTITKRVFFNIPGEKRQDASVTFKYLEKDEWKILNEQIKNIDPDDDIDHDYELMKDMIVNVEGTQDAEGTPVTYSDDVLKQLMNIIPVASALVKAYLKMQTDLGEKAKAKEKN